MDAGKKLSPRPSLAVLFALCTRGISFMLFILPVVCLPYFIPGSSKLASVCVCLAVGLHVVYRMPPAAANPHCSLATEQRLRGEQVYTPVGSWLSQTQDLNVGVEIAHQPKS